MSDNYLQFTQSPLGSKLISTLGLPLPTPPKLRRPSGAWDSAPLKGSKVMIAGSDGSGLSAAIIIASNALGAELLLPTDSAGVKPIKDAAAQAGIGMTGAVPGESDGEKVHAIIFDASGMTRVSQLRDLYDTFHSRIRQIRNNGRVIVLGRPPEEQKGVEARTAQRALEGFTRSIAKEMGKKAINSHLIYVEKGAEDRVAGPLRFALTPSSAFVTGQVLRISKQVSGTVELPTTQPLAGKVALVTGAARGIGASIARIMAREGATVVCLDRPGEEDNLDIITKEIKGFPLAVDVTDERAPQIIEKALKDEFGGVDIVVHNAGVTRDKTIARMRPEWWDMALGINLEAIVRMNETLLKGAIRDGGRIVCVSSISGIAGNVGQTNYATSKAGVIGYVQALSQETAKKGISVNAVAPGFIETQMTNAMPAGIREAGRRLNALSQGGSPDDVAEAITFMSSPAAIGVNGVVLRVCGLSIVGA